jgi:hypothetical protein
MEKSDPNKPKQLSLGFGEKKSGNPAAHVSSATVVRFQDAKTIEVRKHAAARVAASGIFVSPLKVK